MPLRGSSAESLLFASRDRRFHPKANFRRATISESLPGRFGLACGALSRADVLYSLFVREL
jgi:hypothetical protein